MPITLLVKKLVIPDYEDECDNVITLSSTNIEIDEQYVRLAKKISKSIGKEFLPIVRVSDGEFNLLLGEQLPGPWWPIAMRIRKVYGLITRKFVNAKSFSNANYSGSNVVSALEVKRIQESSIEGLRLIMEKGVLAAHLSLTIHPFQADYLLPLFSMLKKNEIDFTSKNLVPFYFIYPLVLSSYGDFFFQNRSVMIIHSATGDKKNRIIKAVEARSAKKVIWVSISHDRTFYDEVDIEGYVGKADIAFIGAGVAKLILIQQLTVLNIPVVDIGFVFEVWNNPDLSNERPFCKLK